MMFSSPIHHIFAPHVDRRYLFETLKILCNPFSWSIGIDNQRLRSAIGEKFRTDVFLFSSGREALLALLYALNMQKNDEIIVQRYTCMVVPNAIKKAGGTIIYADIDQDTLNLYSRDVESRITDRTRALIYQHTFGISCDISNISKICKEHNIAFIEDCAHIIPKSIDSDFAFFSFGRDKAISGITGGAVLSRNPEVSLYLKELEKNAQNLSYFYIKRLLLYPIIYAISRPLYGIWIGKITLKCAKISRFLVPIVSNKEKRGNMSHILHRLPNACAKLALFDWKRLHQKNEHRCELTSFYLEEAQKNGWRFPLNISKDMPLQKFSILVKNADRIRKKLKNKNIHLGDGWENCPDILNLPTHPTMSLRQAKKLVHYLRKELKN